MSFLWKRLALLGFEGAVPNGVGMLGDQIKSNWSQRHIAYQCGLGTFGMNNMLIGKAGCCGRYNSIVAKLPLTVFDGPLQEEYCLYKRNGSCAKCISNCFSRALTKDGFDRQKCFEVCMINYQNYGVDVCGKCNTGIPCAHKIPVREAIK